MTDAELYESVRAGLDEVAEQRWKWVRRHVDEIATLRREPLVQFEERLLARWRKPFALFEAVLQLSFELGEMYNHRHRPRAAKRQDVVFEALTRLHARALLTASEVLALLRAGHPSGAHARWRTLHELSVVTQFLSKHGRPSAERYLLFDVITREKAARNFQTCAARLRERPLPKRTLKRLREARDRLVERFGTRFADGDQGWAALDLTGKGRPTIRDLEENVGLDHFRAYYQMASHPVHAGPHGTVWNLELEAGNVLVAGPSNYGLADPGQGALVTLNQINITLVLRTIEGISTKNYAEYIVNMEVLKRLVDFASASFVHVQRQIEREERQKKRR